MALVGGLLVSAIWEYRALAPLAYRNPTLTSYMRLKGRKDNSRAHWTLITDISPILICAVVKAEDRAFFRHDGWDVGAMWDALQRRMAAMPSGHGTTITQQLARNLFLSPKRSVDRKMRELLIARRLEASISKTRILELYLNTAEWGPDIWGVASASEYYFGVAPAQLSAFDASFLSALLPSPATSPTSSNAARIRVVQRRVLVQLALSEILPRDEAEGALFLADTWRDSTINEDWRLQLRRAARYTHEYHPGDSPSTAAVVATGCGYEKELSHVNPILKVQ